MLKLCYQNEFTEAGCDEAGRGCLAGPVVASAVILPAGFYHPMLNDSKQLSETQRNILEPIIKQEAVSWSVGVCDNVEIDKINILKASFLAMHKAIAQLKVEPGLLLIDGNRFIPYSGIPHKCIVKGDAQFMHIAAASILAKTHRDKLMEQLHTNYPVYQWNKNKGYPTAAHRNAIATYGSTEFHRKSFRLLHERPNLF
ncbi:MAG: ribonuclease HII [Chitinophagales bacterium]